MPINLTGAQAAVERLLLVDDCQIMKGDDRLEIGLVHDPVTGNIATPAPVQLYAGKCQVSPASRLPQDTVIGGVPIAELDYVVKISKDAVLTDELMVEDTVIITAVHDGGDPWLVNKDFEVRSYEVSTYSVTRVIGCTLKVPTPDG